MRKFLLRHSVLVATMIFAIAVVGPVAVTAASAKAHESQTGVHEDDGTPHTKKTEKQEAAKTKLTETKLKSCQKREKSINNIMARMSDRGTKQLGVFNKISERTQAFYAEKGKTLANYDALVADVNAKKAAAETAIAATAGTSVTFKCDGTDPKGAAASFKDSQKAQTQALKDYKTAVKNLIVGVKSVNGKTSSTENKTSDGGQQ